MTTKKKVQATWGVLALLDKAMRLKCVTIKEQNALLNCQRCVECKRDLDMNDFLVIREMSKRYDAVMTPYQESVELMDCVKRALEVGGKDEST